MNENEKEQVTWENMFKNPWYWELVSKLPKITQNPKKLAYLRAPFKDIYKTIFSRYQVIR
jgi:hypothetical protein